MSMLTLTEEQLADMIADVKTKLVERLLTEKRDDLELLTPAQVCGLLNVNQKTLDAISPKLLPKVIVVVRSIIRYRACDVASYIKGPRET